MTSTSQYTSTRPVASDVVPQVYDDSRRDSANSDMVHHLYFEDNDSFFPPRWLGKDTVPSPRRSSDDPSTYTPQTEDQNES